MGLYQYTKGIFFFPNSLSSGNGFLYAEAPFDMEGDDISISLHVTQFSSTGGTTVTNQAFSATGVQSTEFGQGSYPVTGYSVLGDPDGAGPLTGKSVDFNASPNRAQFKATDHEYPSIGSNSGGDNATFDHIVVMRKPDSGAAAGNINVLGWTTTAATLTNGGNVTLRFDSTGLMHIT